MSDISDEALMHRVRDGDVGQLDELFRRHSAAVYALCARLTSRAAAEDLAQDVFLRVLRYRATWRGERSFVPWLLRIARNVCSDYLARSRREVEATAEWSGGAVASEDGSCAALLEAALGRLAPEAREVVVLARFHDLPGVRVAEVLGCSPGAVRVRLHRALKELRQIVQEMESRDDDVRRVGRPNRG